MAEIDPAALARRKKLEVALKELRIKELEIDVKYKHMLGGIINRCLDEFAANDDDLRHTEQVKHEIDTGEAVPINERASKILFRRKQF